MSQKWYATERVMAFIILLLAYGGVYGLLWWSSSQGKLSFASITGVENLLISMPFVSLYIVVLVGFAAGYARTHVAARALGLAQAVRAGLRTRSMESATIKSKIRSNSAVTPDTPFLRTLEKVVTARLPLLPVVENEKVTSVITMHNITQQLTHQINTVQEESKTEELFRRLAALKVKDANPRPAVTCGGNDNLESVLDRMMQHKLTKLVVVGRDGETYMGTVDLFDLVSEMLAEPGEAT